MTTISSLKVNGTENRGGDIIRRRQDVWTIEMTFDQFQKHSFLKPMLRKNGVAFEETEL